MKRVHDRERGGGNTEGKRERKRVEGAGGERAKDVI